MAQVRDRNPPGEQAHYNTDGVHIKHLEEGEAKAIDDVFFSGYPAYMELLFNEKKYRRSIINLNNQLFSTYNKRIRKMNKLEEKKRQDRMEEQ